jgi:hypothetical protein
MINSLCNRLKLGGGNTSIPHVADRRSSAGQGGGHLRIEYVGFESNAQSRDYRYVVTDREQEPREFTFSVSLRALIDRRVSYQDVACLCYEKLRQSLAVETAEHPLPLDAYLSEQDLDDYRDKHSPPRRRPSGYHPARRPQRMEQ